MGLPIRFAVLRGLIKELQTSARDGRPLVIGGAGELARVLGRELAAGGDPSAVRGGDPAGGAAYVHVLAGTDEDEPALKRARRARVPITAVAVGPAAGDAPVPFVLATDVVRVPAGEGFPLERIAEVVAARLGEDAAPLAARLPVLRRPVCRRLVASFSARNGVVAAAVFIPGADLPVLTLNEVRMLLRIEQAHGLAVDPRERAPEILASLVAGVGLRAVTRELLDLVPVAGWAVKGAVAYAGTRALGEAAIRRLEASAPTPPPAAASRAAP
ncbi:MAG: hypothetical protein V7644_1786 [Actinomycetota bacterium]